MSIRPLPQEDVRVLEQIRQRVFQLSNNIASLKHDVQHGNPLPPWSSIQASTSILSKSINSLTEHLQRNSDLLNRLVAFPSTNYPGRTQENALGSLLRKKYEPHVEDWVQEGRALQNETRDSNTEDEELWSWAAGWIGPRVRTYILEESQDMYTPEERENGIENVRTGLKRKLDDDEDENSEDDEDEEMEDVGGEVTTVGRTNNGQVEYGVHAVKKAPNGSAQKLDAIAQFAIGRAGTGQRSNGNR